MEPQQVVGQVRLRQLRVKKNVGCGIPQSILPNGTTPEEAGVDCYPQWSTADFPWYQSYVPYGGEDDNKWPFYWGDTYSLEVGYYGMYPGSYMHHITSYDIHAIIEFQL